MEAIGVEDILPEEIDEMIEMADYNSDGAIDFNEFCQLVDTNGPDEVRTLPGQAACCLLLSFSHKQD